MLEKIAKAVLKKWVFITLIVIEICGIAALVWARVQEDNYLYKGFVIDNKFLDALVMNEFYRTLELVFIVFDGFLLMAIIFYAIAFVKFKKNMLYPKDQSILFGIFAFLAVAVLSPFSTISDLRSRGSEKPFVNVESIVDKKIDSYKSSKSYYLTFSSGATYKVPQHTFYSSHTGMALYTVYQGKSIIHIFPIDKYTLKKD